MSKDTLTAPFPYFGGKDAPPITSNPAKPGAPAVWNPHAGYCIDSGPFDPRCAYCRWRGVCLGCRHT